MGEEEVSGVGSESVREELSRELHQMSTTEEGGSGDRLMNTITLHVYTCIYLHMCMRAACILMES